MYAILALLSEGKYDVANRDGESETTQGRTTGGVVGYLKRNVRIQGLLTTHASVGRGAGVGTVQLQSTAQVEARKR